MNNGFASTFVVIITGIITVAIIAVIVGKNSQTANVVETFGTAFSGILKTVVTPVS